MEKTTDIMQNEECEEAARWRRKMDVAIARPVKARPQRRCSGCGTLETAETALTVAALYCWRCSECSTVCATPFADALDTLLLGWTRTMNRRAREWQISIRWNDEVLLFPAAEDPARVRWARVEEPCVYPEEKVEAQTIRRLYGPGGRERFFTPLELDGNDVMGGETFLADVSEVIAVLGREQWLAAKKAGLPTDVASAIRVLAAVGQE